MQCHCALSRISDSSLIKYAVCGTDVREFFCLEVRLRQAWRLLSLVLEWIIPHIRIMSYASSAGHGEKEFDLFPFLWIGESSSNSICQCTFRSIDAVQPYIPSLADHSNSSYARLRICPGKRNMRVRICGYIRLVCGGERNMQHVTRYNSHI